MKTKIAGLMTAFMAVSVPLVWADNGDMQKMGMHEGGWGHEDHEEMMAKILNLSDDQVKQLKVLHDKQKEAMKSNFDQMKSDKDAFDAEIVKASADMNKISDLQNKIKALQAQMLDDHLNSMIAIKKILTPEQFAGFIALHKEKEMKEHMMGHGK